MTDEQQLQAIAEHLRKHGLRANVYAYAVRASDKENYPDTTLVVAGGCYWEAGCMSPTIQAHTVRPYSTPVDAFNAIATAAGVPRLELP